MPFVAVAGAVVGGIATMAASENAADAADRNGERAAASADRATDLGFAELDFTKQQYEDAKPVRDAAAATAQKVSEAQLAALQQNTTIANEYNEYNKGTFRPLEKELVADAQGYNTAERRQAAADAATADVGAGFSQAAGATARRLAASGVTAGSARSVAALGGQDIAQATASAGAATAARQRVETTGHALEMDAASLGRNLPSAQATSANVATNAGNSAVSAGNAALAATNAGVAGVQAGYAGAIGANTAAGSIYNSAANTALSSANQSNALWGQLGSSAGSFAASPTGQSALSNLGSLFGTNTYGGSVPGAYVAPETGVTYNNPSAYIASDKNIKRDIAPVTDEDALAAVKGTPVSSWQYDQDKAAAAGLDPSQTPAGTHIGPMAQDVNRTMGEGAAPGGKKINPTTVIGVALRGLQAVDKKVEGLAEQVKGMGEMIRSGRIGAGMGAAA